MTQIVSKREDVAGDQLSIEYWPIERLVPSARNARTHSAVQVAEIAGSIRTFGFTNPLLVGEDSDVVAGHGRLAAARLLGMTEVPVIPLRKLNEMERRQLMLADNRIALNAGWDIEMLKLELADLNSLGADLKILGFSEEELATALGTTVPGLVHEDEVPDLAETAVSQTGDVWLLGAHRIGCGDCRDSKLVSAVLGSALPQLMVTDPPYGAGFTIRAQIIWAKERLVMSQGDYHWQHEPCWYAVRKRGHWTGDRKQTTLWSISSGGQDAETRHATQKPVECMRRPMLNNSNPGQAIYEPFLGSGTTLIAAQSSARICLAIEIDSLFVDLAIRRWQTFTGEKAVREGDGVCFEEIGRTVDRPEA